MSDIEHVAIGNRAGRRQRISGSWHEHGAVRVINVKAAKEAASERSRGDACDIDRQNREVEMGGST